MKKELLVPSKEMTVQSNWSIPSLFKTTAAWRYEDKISVGDFLYSIENLVAREIIVI
ncbi:MAG TPA: hypothetical protein VMW55_08335 [Nitrosopumilaceae archaeon]|nr:hypothetical protein [Nitrosopumilaceae archaeon]